MFLIGIIIPIVRFFVYRIFNNYKLLRELNFMFIQDCKTAVGQCQIALASPATSIVDVLSFDISKA
jgi:hypothetical protein